MNESTAQVNMEPVSDSRYSIDWDAIQDAGIEPALDMLGIEPVYSRGQIKFLCPCHNDHAPSANIWGKGENAGKKWGCFPCGVSGDNIHLVSQAKHIPRYQAAIELGKFLGIGLSLENEQSASEQPTRHAKKTELAYIGLDKDPRLAARIRTDEQASAETFTLDAEAANMIICNKLSERYAYDTLVHRIVLSLLNDKSDETVSLSYRCLQGPREYLDDLALSIFGIDMDITSEYQYPFHGFITNFEMEDLSGSNIPILTDTTLKILNLSPSIYTGKDGLFLSSAKLCALIKYKADEALSFYNRLYDDIQSVYDPLFSRDLINTRPLTHTIMCLKCIKQTAQQEWKYHINKQIYRQYRNTEPDHRHLDAIEDNNQPTPAICWIFGQKGDPR